MPSPLAHSAAGYALYQLLRRPDVPEPDLLLATTLFSLLPDADSVLGLVGRDFARYHNNISHSLGFAVLAALGAGLTAWWRNGRFWRGLVVGFLAYSSHLSLDYWSTRRGILLFWPISRRRFVSPARLFYGFRWGRGVWSITHLWTVLTELVFAAALIAVGQLARGWKQ